ncbi:hypothetical protein LPJGGPFB_03512 [Ensifer adhaerens]|uniref:Uncharacterized protein n=1 Tax=Ensifer adhaerens TaxID=106592 RepID=A0ACC5SRI2_ENSAD|nr:hypothetical protein [Ensifer adhaerens]MBP1871491.1 hypothetical protein [Ensifer adhaerens]NRP20253.1 hypothetical protein [Ensifer adhaerens]
MCSLCGVLGGNEHWADAVARPGVYTRNVERIDRRRERANRVRIANGMLARFGLTITDWQGASFVLATRTGKSEIIEDLGHLWPAAERLCGRPCDPLDVDLIAAAEVAIDD